MQELNVPDFKSHGQNYFSISLLRPNPFRAMLVI